MTGCEDKTQAISDFLHPVTTFKGTTAFGATDHWNRVEQQVPQVHQVSQDERLGEFRSRNLDGILQILCNVWQRKPHIREEGDDGHQPCTAGEI